MRRHLELQIWGRVQGVGFRAFTRKRALALNITGWVSNVEDGSVKVAAEGEPDALQKLPDDQREVFLLRYEDFSLQSNQTPQFLQS